MRVSELVPFDDVMAAQLARALAQLEAGPSCESLQALSRLAHALPASALPPCFAQVSSGVAGLRIDGLLLAHGAAGM